MPKDGKQQEPGGGGAVPDRRIWIDGTLVPWEQATVHVLSHSLQRGSLVFDYMSVHATERGPAVFRLREHVARFLRSVELVGLPLGADAERLREAILETVRANPGATAVKIAAYLPAIEVDVVPMDARVSVAIAAYDPIHDVVARKASPRPAPPTLRVRLERERHKGAAGGIPPQAKVAANYLGPMIAKWAARRAGFDEILLVDEDGNLAEGPTTNVFLVERDGTLTTPPAGSILEGVTRSSVLEIAKHDGRSVREAPLRPEALFDAAEVFLTGTTAGVWPVVEVSGRSVGGGRPGPVTEALRARLAEVVAGRDPDFLAWLSFVDEA